MCVIITSRSDSEYYNNKRSKGARKLVVEDFVDSDGGDEETTSKVT